MPLITLTTDFGLEDWFVGTMKGVIASIAPGARVIDITHGIAPGDVVGGAFALAASTQFFPQETIHVAVVDQGVGSARGAIVARCRGQVFIAPDNGLLSLVVPDDEEARIHRLENDRFFLHPVSRTFHGRDVFAPVAAHVCNGVELDEFGPLIDSIHRVSFPHPVEAGNGRQGEVIHLDRFGNAIANIGELRSDLSETVLADGTRIPIGSCYADVAAGKPVAVFGSSGFLEIAINGGNAARTLGLHRGARVIVR